MSASLRLGLNVPYIEGQMDGATPRWSDIRAMAQAAERVGFDSVWISDHVGSSGAPRILGGSIDLGVAKSAHIE